MSQFMFGTTGVQALNAMIAGSRKGKGCPLQAYIIQNCASSPFGVFLGQSTCLGNSKYLLQNAQVTCAIRIYWYGVATTLML